MLKLNFILVTFNMKLFFQFIEGLLGMMFTNFTSNTAIFCNIENLPHNSPLIKKVDI
jgi:hypothetical protein